MNVRGRLYMGLDLGQASDYTALTIVDRFKAQTGEPMEATETRLHLRYIERFPLGTSYPAIVQRVKDLSDRLGEHLAACVVDKTGVGAPVVDMLIRAECRCAIVPITITGGHDVYQHGLEYSVPKRDLVSRLQVLLQTGRLQYAEALPLVDVLKKELQNFKAKISASGHDSYEAWREGDHDDLVLSLAMVCWYGNQEHWVMT